MQELFQAYADKRESIAEQRLLSWSSAGAQDTALGLAVRPLTMRAWVDLKLAGNAFVNDTEPTEGDVFAYVWRNSESFTTATGWRGRRAKRRVERACLTLPIVDQVAFVLDHIEQAFTETPESPHKGGYSRSNALPPVEGCATAADELGARYGIDPELVMDWPLNRIFQLQKAARLATVSEYKLLEPEPLRRIASQILEAQNG